jgi:hypothetical protein
MSFSLTNGELDKLAELVESKNYQDPSGYTLDKDILRTFKRYCRSGVRTDVIYCYLHPEGHPGFATEEELSYFNSRREFYRKRNEREEEAEKSFQDSLKELSVCEVILCIAEKYKNDPESIFNDPGFVERLMGTKCGDEE